MARKTKASTRKSAGKTRAKAQTKARRAKPAAGGRKAGAGRKGKAGTAKGAAQTDVERRWAEYLGQRTELEAAVEAVRSASEQLAAARSAEATRRKQFDAAKRSLEQLLEVDAARAGADRAAGPPGAGTGAGPRRPLDVPGPGRNAIAGSDKEARPT